MERLRSFKISVEVDTNKSTYSKEFDDVDEMLEWLEMLGVGDFSPTKRADQMNLSKSVMGKNFVRFATRPAANARRWADTLQRRKYE